MDLDGQEMAEGEPFFHLSIYNRETVSHGPTLMQAARQEFIAASISRADQPNPGRESSQETHEPALWSQWHITQLYPELLSHIFSYLGCDDIVQVKNTCQRFREMVQLEKREVIFYCQLPKLFRKRHPHALPWLKWMVQNSLHPFTNRLPGKMSRISNAEQQAAILCFHTLRKMRAASEYRPVQVYAGDCPTFVMELYLSPCSSDLLLNSVVFSGMYLLSQNEPGSWSEQKLIPGGRPRICDGVSFSTDGRYLSIFSTDNLIEIYKRDSDKWPLIKRQSVNMAKWFTVSPSGKYLVAMTENSGIVSIRYFDGQGHWKSMPMAENVRINSSVKAVQFSASEQHMAIEYKNKVMTLSLDSHGCWNLSCEATSDLRIDYVRLSPSGRWLLIAAHGNFLNDGAVDMVKLNPLQKGKPRQTIASEYLKLTFSPAGNYLVSQIGKKQYWLWRLDKSGDWVLYGNLIGPGAALWRGLEQTKLKQNTTTFSPCDNYLLTSFQRGAVKIWGQNEQGNWTVRGIDQHDGEVQFVEFSQSGVHALTADRCSLHIWGRDEGGLWSVKGIIRANNIFRAHFHPVAEHLIVCMNWTSIEIWEMRKGDSCP